MKIKIIWSKSYQQIILPVLYLSVLFLEMGLLAIDQIYHIPKYVFFTPLYLFFVYLFLMLMVNDFLSFIKIRSSFALLSLIATNLMTAYYLVWTALSYKGAFGITILSLMGLFYGTFLWDFFMGQPYIDKITKKHSKELNETIKRSREIEIRGFQDILTPIKEKPKSIFLRIALYFSLPLLLLGKTGAYFLGVWLVHELDTPIFSLVSFFWLVSLVLLMFHGSIFNAIANFKLKYPTQEEIEAYKSKGKV